MQENLRDWQYWILQNLQLLSNIYGKNGVLLSAKSWQCISITNFELPHNWRQTSSKLFIILPEKAQIFYAPPNRFYLERGLRTTSGLKPAHYFEDSGYNDLAGSNLARFSFHLNEGWHPRIPCNHGTTLIHVLQGLYLGLKSAAREAMR